MIPECRRYNEVLIRCRKCRRLVARGVNALPHQPGVGLDAFSWHQRTKHVNGGDKSTVVASSGTSDDSALSKAGAEAAAAAAAAAAATIGSVTGAGAGAGVTGHWQGGGGGGGRGASSAPPCQNIFLEPLAWMDGIEEGAVEGKLCCPRCAVNCRTPHQRAKPLTLGQKP